MLIAALNRIGGNREMKKQLEDRAKELGKLIKADTESVLATFDARGITRMGIAGVGLFYTQSKAYPAVHDPVGLIQWLDDRGEGAIARRTVHPQTLRAYWKQLMERGGEVPPESIATAHTEREVRLKKGT